MVAAGGIILASDLNAVRWSRLTAAVPITNSIGFIATGISFTALANAVFELEMTLLYGGPAAADIKFDLQGPAGGNAQITPNGLVVGTAAASGDIDRIVLNGFGTAWASGADGTNANCAKPSALITIAGTSGTVSLRFAQNAANATTTNLFAGSRARMTRIA
jgi:hypothetical protein